MDKHERIEAAHEIRELVDFREIRLSLTFHCGMKVTFNNDPESREALAKKLEKGFRVRNPHLSSKPVAGSSYAVAMKQFIADGEIDNAREYARLHGKEFTE